MKAFRAALLAACAIPLSAQAEPLTLYTFELGDVVARLHDVPCTNAEVQALVPETMEFRSANVEWQGKPYSACWSVVGQQVVVVDETGDAGFLDPSGFEGGRTPVSLKLHGV